MGVRHSIGCETIKMPTYKYQEPNFTKYLKDQKFKLTDVGAHEVMKTDTVMRVGYIEDNQPMNIEKVTIRSYVEAYVNHKKKIMAFQITHEYEAPFELPEVYLLILDKDARDHVEESGKRSLPGGDFRELQVKGDKMRMSKK